MRAFKALQFSKLNETEMRDKTIKPNHLPHMRDNIRYIDAQ